MTRWINEKSLGDRITRSMKKLNRLIDKLDLTNIPLSTGCLSERIVENNLSSPS